MTHDEKYIILTVLESKDSAAELTLAVIREMRHGLIPYLNASATQSIVMQAMCRHEKSPNTDWADIYEVKLIQAQGANDLTTQVCNLMDAGWELAQDMGIVNGTRWQFQWMTRQVQS